MSNVYLVGAGPGDPDLITVKGLRLMQQADVVLYDRLVSSELLNEVSPEAIRIYCGKKPGDFQKQQTHINDWMIEYAEKGYHVVRLKGGDPFVFGRGGEEAVTLVERGISFEIVPGITSGIAAPAYAGIPLTHRGISSSVAFIAGYQCASDSDDVHWNHLIHSVDTLAFYMGVRRLPDICEQLIQHGAASNRPVSLIEWGTTARQRVVTGTLDTIVEKVAAAGVQSPAMIIVGEVVNLQSSLDWFEYAGLSEHSGVLS